MLSSDNAAACSAKRRSATVMGRTSGSRSERSDIAVNSVHRVCLLVNPLPWSFSVGPGNQIRMEQVSEQFHPFYNARPGPGKVRVGIDSINSRVRDLRHLARELGRALEPVSAR